LESNENKNPAAAGQHSSAVFGKQPTEKQDFDWDAALQNETDACGGLDSDVETVLDSRRLIMVVAT
jgi:hypothetical protein